MICILEPWFEHARFTVSFKNKCKFNSSAVNENLCKQTNNIKFLYRKKLNRLIYIYPKE